MSAVTTRSPRQSPEEFIFLVFRIGPVSLAQPVYRLREVLRYRPAKPVPYAPPFIEGIINIRGELIPVFDLRKRFGYPATVTPHTRIIITWISGQIIGLVVDEAARIIHVDKSQIRPVPSLPETALQDLIIGAIIRSDQDDDIILLPDFELLLKPVERREWQAWRLPDQETEPERFETSSDESSDEQKPAKKRSTTKSGSAKGKKRARTSSKARKSRSSR